MTYDDYKNAALQKYGSQDNIPDDVYNALSTFKNNGQDALDDKQYNTIKSLQISNNQPIQDTTPGYDYDKQSDYEDLYANAKAVGYSGLDQAQKDLFNKAYSQSLYAKQGRTLKEAQDETDARSYIANNPESAARAITGLVPAAVSGLAGGIKAAYDAPDNKVDAGLEGAKNSASDSYMNAIKGKGISGIVADPMNALMFVPGVGEWNFLSKVPKLAKVPEVVGAVLTQGLVGAGSTAASEALNPSEKVTWPSILTGGILGGAIRAVSPYISKAGYSLFPYVEKITNNTKDVYLKPEELQAHMANVAFPYTMGRQKAAVKDWREEAGGVFDKAVSDVPENRSFSDINQTDWMNDKNNLQAAGFDPDEASYYSASNTINPRTIYPSVEKDRISQLIEEKRLSHLRGDFPRKVNEKQLDRAIKTRLDDLESKMAAQEQLTTPIQDISTLTTPRDITNGLVPRIDIKGLSKLRRAYSSQYKPNADADERVNNYADQLLHDAIIDRMEAIPEYKKVIERKLPSGYNAKNQYRLSKNLEHFVYSEPPNPRGLARSYDALLNNYAIPTALYHLGKSPYPTLGANALVRGFNQYIQHNGKNKR